MVALTAPLQTRVCQCANESHAFWPLFCCLSLPHCCRRVRAIPVTPVPRTPARRVVQGKQSTSMAITGKTEPTSHHTIGTQPEPHLMKRAEPAPPPTRAMRKAHPPTVADGYPASLNAWVDDNPRASPSAALCGKSLRATRSLSDVDTAYGADGRKEPWFRPEVRCRRNRDAGGVSLSNPGRAKSPPRSVPGWGNFVLHTAQFR